MPKSRLAIQVKDRNVTRPDVQQLVGATSGKDEQETTLIFECEGFTRHAKDEAERIYNEKGREVKFWKIIDRR